MHLKAGGKVPYGPSGISQKSSGRKAKRSEPKKRYMRCNNMNKHSSPKAVN